MDGRARQRREIVPDAGFSIIELVTVVAVMAALLCIAIPMFGDSRERAAAGACAANRAITERADHTWWVAKGSHAAAIAQLVGPYLSAAPRCPAGGSYVWLEAPDSSRPARTLICSVHYAPSTGSPLGAGFTSISTGMADLIRRFRASNSSWPRSNPPYNYTDLGLDPATWATPQDHLYYVPGGNRMDISPEAGYTIIVRTTSGKKIEIEAGSKSPLVYDVKSDTWYYKSIGSTKVDITTMQVVAGD